MSPLPNGALFHPGDLDTSRSNAGDSTSLTPFRRKRPMYAGAGLSSSSAARRRRLPHSPAPSQSETPSKQDNLHLLGANEVAANEKRRRIETPPAPEASVASRLAALANKPQRGLFGQPASHPEAQPPKPSPLWQVSHLGTHLSRYPPEPRLRQTLIADGPSPSSSPEQAKKESPKPASRTAEMMKSIIQEEEDKSRKVARTDKQLSNPYEKLESPVVRVPRSRPSRQSTPASSRRAATRQSATPAKEQSPLELLEKSMPAEYRAAKNKSGRSGSQPAEPSAAASQNSLKPSPAAPSPSLLKPSAPSTSTFAFSSALSTASAFGAPAAAPFAAPSRTGVPTPSPFAQPSQLKPSWQATPKKPSQEGAPAKKPAGSATVIDIDDSDDDEPAPAPASKPAPAPAPKPASESAPLFGVVSQKPSVPATGKKDAPKPAFSLGVQPAAPAPSAAASPSTNGALATTPFIGFGTKPENVQTTLAFGKGKAAADKKAPSPSPPAITVSPAAPAASLPPAAEAAPTSPAEPMSEEEVRRHVLALSKASLAAAMPSPFTDLLKRVGSSVASAAADEQAARAEVLSLSREALSAEAL